MSGSKENSRSQLSMFSAKRLDVSALEGWLWDAACQIRGPLDAPKPLGSGNT